MIQDAPCLHLVRVEDASAAELDDVMSIMIASFDPRYGEAWTRIQCAGILPMTGVGLKIARTADHAPAGFCLFRTIAGEAELLLLAVQPEQRRQGVGRRLLDEFVRAARASGASQLHLEVRANNPAIDMYRAAGFAPVGRRSNYYNGDDGARFDAITLARSI